MRAYGSECCCASCYYLRPAVCCDGGGPVRYRVRSSSALLAAFAASGDPLYAYIEPSGLIYYEVPPPFGEPVTFIGFDELITDFQCWLVEASTDCDEGELIDWMEFDGEAVDGVYALPNNVETATVLYDPVTYPAPEECEENNPDDCPVICDGVCYSASATVSVTITATLTLSDASEVEIDFAVEDLPMFSGCEEASWCGGDACAPDTSGESISGFGCGDAVAYRKLSLPGPTTNVGISWDEDGVPTISDNQWDATRTVTGVVTSGVTITRNSATAWELVEGVCVAVDPEEEE